MDEQQKLRDALTEDARMRFEARYERMASWDVDFPQPVFVELAQRGAIRSPVLDAGCGSGEIALYLASRGFDVWGIDLVGAAIARARAKATVRGLPAARFLVGDALRLEDLGMTFSTVVDSGLLHAFCDEERAFFVQGLARILAPGGFYHFLGFSDRQPGTDGPRRLTEADIRTTFGAGWKIHALTHVRFQTRIHEGGAAAWLGSIERTVEVEQTYSNPG